MSSTIILTGTIASNPTFSHKCRNESFWKFNIKILRLSGVSDVLPIVAPELICRSFFVGDKVDIFGDVRTRTIIDLENNAHNELTVFCKRICYSFEPSDRNYISITGHIKTNRGVRETPKKREIADFILASDRRYKKTDHIPCVAWGRNAHALDYIDKAETIELFGRLQSRKYYKVYPNDVIEEKTTYEISTECIEVQE